MIVMTIAKKVYTKELAAVFGNSTSIGIFQGNKAGYPQESAA